MPQGTGTKPPSWAGWQGVEGCRQTPAGPGGLICLALSLSVQPQKRGAPGRQSRKQGRGTRVMQKDGQTLWSTEPRMTHVLLRRGHWSWALRDKKWPRSRKANWKREKAKARVRRGESRSGDCWEPFGGQAAGEARAAEGPRFQGAGVGLSEGRRGTQGKGGKRGTEFKFIGLHNPTALLGVHGVSGTW